MIIIISHYHIIPHTRTAKSTDTVVRVSTHLPTELSVTVTISSEK